MPDALFCHAKRFLAVATSRAGIERLAAARAQLSAAATCSGVSQIGRVARAADADDLDVPIGVQ